MNHQLENYWLKKPQIALSSESITLFASIQLNDGEATERLEKSGISRVKVRRNKKPLKKSKMQSQLVYRFGQSVECRLQ